MNWLRPKNMGQMASIALLLCVQAWLTQHRAYHHHDLQLQHQHAGSSGVHSHGHEEHTHSHLLDHSHDNVGHSHYEGHEHCHDNQAPHGDEEHEILGLLVQKKGSYWEDKPGNTQDEGLNVGSEDGTSDTPSVPLVALYAEMGIALFPPPAQSWGSRLETTAPRNQTHHAIRPRAPPVLYFI